jgi:hypothetical protein
MQCTTVILLPFMYVVVGQANLHDPRFIESIEEAISMIQFPHKNTGVNPPSPGRKFEKKQPYHCGFFLSHSSGVWHFGVHACIAAISSLSAALTSRCRASVVFLVNCGDTIMASYIWPHPPVLVVSLFMWFLIDPFFSVSQLKIRDFPSKWRNIDDIHTAQICDCDVFRA